MMRSLVITLAVLCCAVLIDGLKCYSTPQDSAVMTRKTDITDKSKVCEATKYCVRAVMKGKFNMPAQSIIMEDGSKINTPAREIDTNGVIMQSCDNVDPQTAKICNDNKLEKFTATNPAMSGVTMSGSCCTEDFCNTADFESNAAIIAGSALILAVSSMLVL